MATSTTSAQSHAVLKFVETGEYPENGNVLAEPIAKESLPQLRTQLRHAREEAENGIRNISRDVSRDVDGWISRAKQLQVDIEQSRSIAREVVAEAEHARTLKESYTDASNKVNLLRGETSFNDQLLQDLSQIRSAYTYLRAAQKSIEAGQIEQSLIHLQDLEVAVDDVGPISQTSAVELLEQRSLELRKTLIDTAHRLWSSIVVVNKHEHSITINQSTPTDNTGNNLSIDDVARISASLGILDSQLSRLCHDLQEAILAPLLARRLSIEVRDTGLLLASESHTSDILDDLSNVVRFLSGHLPEQQATSLSKDLMPSLIRRLLSFELNDAIPTSIDELSVYQGLLGRVGSFAGLLGSIGWAGSAELTDWAKQAAKVWLTKRRESSIDSIRYMVTSKLSSTQVVERSETQTVTRDDAIADADGHDEDWDENWGDEEKNDHQEHTVPPQADVEEEDMSGWDEEEDATKSADHTTNGTPSTHKTDNPDEEADAWGWDEQQPDKGAASSPVKSRKASPPKVNGHSKDHPLKATATKKLTLRETYTITALPDTLYSLIAALVSDSTALQQPPLLNTPAGPASNGLLSVPTLTLATFRALAPTHYDVLPGGPMYLYNDTLRLSSLLADLPPHDTTRLNLAPDIDNLLSFGRRAYGRTMDAHRTILRDLIDNAQGFANCTTAPYAAECANAVSATVSHIQSIASEWSAVLSRSALLQSLGSLVGAVIDKIILDIEEISDIGADESERLVQLCRQFIEKVEPLFVQEEPETGERRGMAGLYVRGWTKFEWLAMVLESGLADITWMWKEGGLKRDFGHEEVVELLTALFADNEYRARTVREVRRG